MADYCNNHTLLSIAFMARPQNKDEYGTGKDLSSGIGEFIADSLKALGLYPEGFAYHSLRGDGSKRIFWRILPPEAPTGFIAMENAPTDTLSRRENRAYLRIGRHLFERGLPLPEIYRFNLKRGWFFMEDLGETSLQDWASCNRNRTGMYEKVVEILFRLQTKGSEGFDTAWTCQTERYDPFVMRRYEAEYFRDAFLVNYLGLKADWPELEAPFNYLAEKASMAENRFFLHRDFQSRNIMISHDGIGIIDWQGGRLGPLAYDLASLLIDPYTSLSVDEKEGIYGAYLRYLKESQFGNVDAFQRTYPYLALQRNLQILGAFAFLTRARGKTYFEVYIPPALESLHALLDTLNDPDLLSLKELAGALLTAP
jgi:aminoglycoside/choline kinase family phosphotransferase